MRFSRIVSLGAVCQVGHQIRRRYGVTPSNPFDWIATPLRSYAKIFTDDGAGFGLAAEARGETGVCSLYGVGYHHEFPRRDDRTPIITESTLEACRSKLTTKYRRLVDRLADGEPTLFVRLLGHHDRANADHLTSEPEPLRHSDVNCLVSALEARFPALPFRLAMVRMSGVTELVEDTWADPRADFHVMPYCPHWTGDDMEWDRVFSSYSVEGLEASEPDVTREYLHP